jgi:hypothetical protein
MRPERGWGEVKIIRDLFILSNGIKGIQKNLNYDLP